MSWWNFGGLNPKYKDFIESHPDKTMLGMAWAYYWRFALFMFVIYAVVGIVFLLIALIAGH